MRRCTAAAAPTPQLLLCLLSWLLWGWSARIAHAQFNQFGVLMASPPPGAIMGGEHPEAVVLPPAPITEGAGIFVQHDAGVAAAALAVSDGSGIRAQQQVTVGVTTASTSTAASDVPSPEEAAAASLRACYMTPGIPNDRGATFKGFLNGQNPWCAATRVVGQSAQQQLAYMSLPDGLCTTRWLDP
jgi:hypothetical protein